jgi:hypothetical protein
MPALRPDFDVMSFLAELDRPASVATVTQRAGPALASMWFWFSDERFWFHSPTLEPAPFLRAAGEGRLVAVMVETFDPTGRVMKVRTTGPARVEPFDRERAVRIYDRYLSSSDAWTPGWEAQVVDDHYQLWSVEPAVGTAVQYPQLNDAGGAYRWRTAAEFIEATTTSPL